MASISHLVSALNEATEELSSEDAPLTPQSRAELAKACTGLMATLASPAEAIFEMMMAVSLFSGLDTLSEV